MIKKLSKFKPLILLTLLLIFNSCQVEEQTEELTVKGSNFVSLDEATAIASVLEFPEVNLMKRQSQTGKSSIFKEVDEFLEVKDKNGNPSFYIINYINGGFLILSADNRANPVQAFSPTNNFNLDAENYPSGLVNWLEETNNLIFEIRSSDIEKSKDVAEAWEICNIQRAIDPIGGGGCDDGDDGGGCEDSVYTVGPLLESSWGQSGSYNDLVENINCPYGVAPTGCMATAMAQIMYYYEFPNAYDWGNMLPNEGTFETAKLMRDIGLAVNMDYSCNASGASLENATSAFKTDFGYEGAKLSGYDWNVVQDQLGWGRPVILSAYSTKTEYDCFLGFCSTKYSGGHAWVCDGYRNIYFCESGLNYLQFHMKWGWNSLFDGWYAYDNWNPGTSDYQYRKQMIFNLNPNN